MCVSLFMHIARVYISPFVAPITHHTIRYDIEILPVLSGFLLGYVVSVIQTGVWEWTGTVDYLLCDVVD